MIPNTQASTDRRPWASVRGRLGLSAEAKLVWEEIWHKAGGRPQTMHCHPAAIGSLFGAEDPLRSGKRSLEALAYIGLITLVECGRGQWVFFVEDPIEVELQRLRRVSDNGQRELYEEPEPDAPEQPAVLSLQNLSRGQELPQQELPGTQHPATGPANLSRGQGLPGTQTGGDCAMTAGLGAEKPAVIAQSVAISQKIGGDCAITADPYLSTSSKEVSKSTSNLDFPNLPHLSAEKTGGDCATTADARRLADAQVTASEASRIAGGLRAEQQAKRPLKEPALAGGIIDQVLQRVEGRAAAHAGDAHALARYIFERVKHKRLARGICDRIAWAIIRGEYPREKLEGVLRQTDAQRATGREDVQIYFIGVMKKSFQQHGAGDLVRGKAVDVAPSEEA